jgi:hypothetical protein
MLSKLSMQKSLTMPVHVPSLVVFETTNRSEDYLGLKRLGMAHKALTVLLDPDCALFSTLHGSINCTNLLVWDLTVPRLASGNSHKVVIVSCIQ